MDEIVAEDFVNPQLIPVSGITPDRGGLKTAFMIRWDATPGRHEIQGLIGTDST
jgi:hypothetical protein